MSVESAELLIANALALAFIFLAVAILFKAD